MRAVSVLVLASALSAAVAFSVHPGARERRAVDLPSDLRLSENEIEIDPRREDILDHARTKKSATEKKVDEEIKEEKKDEKVTLEDVNTKEEVKTDDAERVRRGHAPLLISPMDTAERSSGFVQNYYGVGQDMMQYPQPVEQMVVPGNEQFPTFTARHHNKGYGYNNHAAIVPIVVKEQQYVQPVVHQVQPVVHQVQPVVQHVQPVVQQVQPVVHQVQPVVQQVQPVVQQVQPVVHQVQPVVHQVQPVHQVQYQPVHLVQPTLQAHVVTAGHACPCYPYGKSDEGIDETVGSPYIMQAPQTHYFRSNDPMRPDGLILSRAAYSDPECSPQNLIGLNLDKNMVEGFLTLEEMKLKKIEECSKKNGNSAEYIALMNNVKEEINLLQSQVTALQSKQKSGQRQ